MSVVLTNATAPSQKHIQPGNVAVVTMHMMSVCNNAPPAHCFSGLPPGANPYILPQHTLCDLPPRSRGYTLADAVFHPRLRTRESRPRPAATSALRLEEHAVTARSRCSEPCFHFGYVDAFLGKAALARFISSPCSSSLVVFASFCRLRRPSLSPRTTPRLDVCHA